VVLSLPGKIKNFSFHFSFHLNSRCESPKIRTAPTDMLLDDVAIDGAVSGLRNLTQRKTVYYIGHTFLTEFG
jgi:hypothetical protein